MKPIVKIILLQIIFTAQSCDPGQRGDARVFNDSRTTLKITYIQYEGGTADTLIKDLPAGEIFLLQTFSGLGDNSTYNCCPYNRILGITVAGQPIKKQSASCDSWIIPNQEKLKKFGGENIRCEFHITDEDI